MIRRHWAVTLLAFAFARLIGYAPHEAPGPTETDLNDVGAIVAAVEDHRDPGRDRGGDDEVLGDNSAGLELVAHEPPQRVVPDDCEQGRAQAEPEIGRAHV